MTLQNPSAPYCYVCGRTHNGQCSIGPTRWAGADWGLSNLPTQPITTTPVVDSVRALESRVADLERRLGHVLEKLRSL